MSKNINELSELIYSRKVEEFLNKIDLKEYNLKALDDSNLSLLHVAAKVENSKSIIEKLIELGLDIDTKDEYGNTPLIHAANYNCPGNVETLLKLHANHSLFNNDLDSALHIACAANNFEIGKILIDHNANVNADGGNKMTPLIVAIYAKASIQLIELLLKNKADINYGNSNGTPLMFAISSKNLALVKFLIDNGAKIKGYKNKSGEDTLTYAKRVGDNEITEYLNESLKK